MRNYFAEIYSGYTLVLFGVSDSMPGVIQDSLVVVVLVPIIYWLLRETQKMAREYSTALADNTNALGEISEQLEALATKVDMSSGMNEQRIERLESFMRKFEQ